MSMDLARAAAPGEPDTMCRECGALVPAVTAEDYNGLCVRCRFAHSSPADVFSDRARTITHALRDLYDSPADRLAWMNSPQALLNGKRPTDLIDTAHGHLDVLTVIARLRDGAYV